MRPVSTEMPVARLGYLRFAPTTIALCLLLAPPAHAETTSTTGAAYATLCSARGVPLPPAFGGASNAWTFSGELRDGQSFNGVQFTSNIFYWNDPSGKGACAADARRSIDGFSKTGFFGVVCQSIHGKVCFWDQASRAEGNASFDWIMTSGSAAHIVAGAPAGKMRVTNLSGMSADRVGRSLDLQNGFSQNTGKFLIATFISSSSVDVVNAAPLVTDNSNIAWETGKVSVPSAITITSTTQANIPSSGPRWSGGADLQTDGANNSGAGMCSACHTGENAYVNHPGSAVDMWSSYRLSNSPTPRIPTASWFPDNWPDPIVPKNDPNGAWPDNAGPATFVDSFPNTTAGIYSAGTTIPQCVSCHTPDGRSISGQSSGGRLASMRKFSTNTSAPNYYTDIVANTGSSPPFLSSCNQNDNILCAGGGMAPVTGGAASDPFFNRLSDDAISSINLARGKNALISSDWIGIGQSAAAARATDGYSNASWWNPDGSTTDTITHSLFDGVSSLNLPYGGSWSTNTGVIQNVYGALTGIGANVFALGTFGTAGALAGRGMTYQYSFAAGNWSQFSGDTFGGRTQISIGANNVLWGVASDSVCSAPNWGPWSCAAGGFFQIAAGNGVNPWAIDTAKTSIYRRDNAGTWVSLLAGSWPGFTAGATLKQIAVGTDEDAWAIDSHGVAIHWVGGYGWKQEQPYFGGNASVNAIAVRNAKNVWASTSSPLGLFNFTPSFHDVPTDSQRRWQHHCPTGGCLTGNSQFVTVSVGLQDNSVYAVTSSATGGLVYQVDESLVVNKNVVSSTDNSLVNIPNPAGVAFAQIAAVGGALGSQHGNIFATATTGTGYRNNNYAGKLPIPGAAWWYVDLGNTYHIENIKIYNRDDGVADRLSNFRILYYTGLTWALGSDQTDTAMTANNLALSINVSFDSRYVLLQLKAQNYLSLSEVEIYGPPVAVTQY